MPGSDADLVIWEPDTPLVYGVKSAQHRTDYNLYEGWKMQDRIQKVFLRGQLIVDQGNWLGKKGQGRFLNCNDPEVI